MRSITTLIWKPLNFLRSLIPTPHTDPVQPLQHEELKAKEQATPIDCLNLSPRVLHCLWKADIRNIETVVSMSDETLLNIRGFGVKALTELKGRLASHYLSDSDTGSIPSEER